jgi:hypothetical protein
MIKIICKEVKNFKLTIDKEYESIEENETKYILRNDTGAKVQYSKKLFNVKREEPVVEAPLTLEEELEEISVDLSMNEDECYVSINGETRTLNYYESVMSCGISETNGINFIIAKIDNSHFNYKKQILHYIFKEMADSDRKNILLVSMNINNYSYTDYFVELMNNFSLNQTEAINPNSGNTIKLFVLDYAKLRESNIEQL